MESAGPPEFGDCGDYSTTVIDRNNLSLIDLKMRSTGNVLIAANYMTVNTLHQQQNNAITARMAHLLFRVSNKKHGKVEAFPMVLIFFLFQ